MQTLRNTLIVSLFLQVSLAAAIFGTAEGAPLALVTLPIALFSMVVIDLTGWLKPPRLMLNLVALGAVGLAVAEFQKDGESRLLAGGHLIVYLTWTFLLQEKDLRRMWWMFALSVLQVAMGSVLTVQPWFGAALLVYTVISVGTMSLLSLTRAALLIDPNLLYPAKRNETPETSPTEAKFAQSFVQNSVRTDEQGRWLSPRFVMGGAATFLLSLVLGITFFVLTPRVWIGNINLMANQNRVSQTGFAESVTLGETAELMETNELVMEVEVIDRQTGETLNGGFGLQPLFRGASLEIYDPKLKAWQSLQRYRVFPLRASRRAPFQVNIRLQPLETTTLFYPGALAGAAGAEDEEAVFFHEWTMTLLRSDDAALGRPFSYSTFVFPPGSSRNSEAKEQFRQEILRVGFRDRVWQEMLSTPSPRISALAQQIVRSAGIDPRENAEAAARTLEAFLRDSSEFEYSFKLSVDDPTIDPIEDFVFNRKSGHCEYFASALAMMLRGVGIPSRMISGFKGADFNVVSKKQEVRTLHAHAWVEAFTDGAWVTFDPTPEARNEEIAEKEKERNEANPLLDQTRSMWFQGMNYSKSQQENMVYAPLRNLFEGGKTLMAGLMEGKLLIPSLGTASGSASASGGSPRMAFFLLTTLGLLALAAVLWIGRFLARKWKRLARDRDITHRRVITVDFYARFLKLMQRCGLSETPTMTPREFALQAEQRFSGKLAPSGLSGVATRLAEAFYSVRFGDTTLTRDQLSEVERELTTLEACLSGGTVA